MKKAVCISLTRLALVPAAAIFLIPSGDVHAEAIGPSPTILYSNSGSPSAIITNPDGGGSTSVTSPTITPSATPSDECGYEGDTNLSDFSCLGDANPDPGEEG